MPKKEIKEVKNNDKSINSKPKKVLVEPMTENVEPEIISKESDEKKYLLV
jgi:hypothetical protein